MHERSLTTLQQFERTCDTTNSNSSFKSQLNLLFINIVIRILDHVKHIVTETIIVHPSLEAKENYKGEQTVLEQSKQTMQCYITILFREKY